MKRIILFILTALAVSMLAGCVPPANNAPATNANANSNANAKPVAAAPTADALLAMDKQANEAYFKGDSAFFEGFLSDKFVIYAGGQRFDKASSVKMIGGVKCDIKEGWKLEEPQMVKIDNDTYVLSYKGTFDGTCTESGKTEKVPSPIRAASVYTRSGDKWQAIYHGENAIVDPNSPPAAADKKDIAKKDDAKPAANADTSAETKPVPSVNTDALVKLHNAGWEAWKAKDAKWFEANTTSNLSFVDPMGKWIGTKAEVIKEWTTMPCEGVTKVSFTEGVATAISPTLEILTGKGSADGTCFGQKNGDLYTTAFYVKEGDAWKLAFMLESPAM